MVWPALRVRPEYAVGQLSLPFVATQRFESGSSATSGRRLMGTSFPHVTFPPEQASPASSVALTLLEQDPLLPHQWSALGDYLADETNHEQVHAFSQRHGILGAVLTAIERLAAARPGRAPSLTRLLVPLATLRRQALLWDLERERVMRILASRGLRPVLLKGAALRLTAYRSPAERTVGDLDLLVREEEVHPAEVALMRAGYVHLSDELQERYRSEHFHSRLHNGAGFHVEVHWGLTPPGRTVQLDADIVRTRAIEVPMASMAIRIPASEDMLLHLAVQMLEDSYTSLRRIVDLDRIVRASPDFDWDYLVRAARTARAEVVLALGLRLAQVLLATPVPPRLMAGLQTSALARVHLAVIDPVRMMLTQYPRMRASAGIYLRTWSNNRLSDVLRNLAREFGGPFRPPPSPFRVGEGPPEVDWFAVRVAKTVGFWAWLWVRRAPLTSRDYLRGRGFWTTRTDRPGATTDRRRQVTRSELVT